VGRLWRKAKLSVYIEMPNTCWNHITITGNKDVIDRFLEKEFKDIPEWVLNIERRGVEALVFCIWSSWTPDFVWLEKLLDTYDNVWIKNEWNEEGGQEGVWIGTNNEDKKDIQRLEWMGMCIEEEVYRFRKVSGE
jgi:hypothetical protein